jgi:hypothetical protein
MNIIQENRQHTILQKDREEIDISEKAILQYTGIYYNPLSNNDRIETDFIGVVECHRKRNEIDIEGIYVKPLYILNPFTKKWNRILKIKPIDNKYFLYPHQLLLPECYHHAYPLYNLHTCKNVYLQDFLHIIETFDIYLGLYTDFGSDA